MTLLGKNSSSQKKQICSFVRITVLPDLLFSLSRIWKRDEMMHFEPFPYISGLRHKGPINSDAVSCTYIFMRLNTIKQAFLWIKFDFSIFCCLCCWNANFLYLGCSHSIFLHNFWGYYSYNVKTWNHLSFVRAERRAVKGTHQQMSACIAPSCRFDSGSQSMWKIYYREVQKQQEQSYWLIEFVS